ncbi:MAG: copper-translocating P-type ATPase [Candidatus Sungbacteria bacterium]|nr:copper-translocating P-type ATPase [Candidatus Sungbacteria bacterium]
MHPEVVSGRPGRCPECGMNLVLVPDASKKAFVDHNGHGMSSPTHGSLDKHAGHRTESFLRKFWIVAALTIPILAYSEITETVFGWAPPTFVGQEYMILALASVVFFYGGGVFLTGAYREIRARLPGMMTLIALAITAAYVFSVFSVFSGRSETLFWELSTLIAVMLIGHWMEMKAVVGAEGALKELAKLLPDTAEVMRHGTVQTIPLAQLVTGDTVLIRPGSKVPADGTIMDGQSDLNESIITGESKPVAKKIGDAVIAGAINGDGALTVRMDKIGEHTFLAGVMRMVADAQASKSRLQMLSDRAALYLTGIAVGSGVITFGAWMFAGAGIVTAVERLVAVLVIACPHALGLAVPLVASISTTKAARNGFLVRERIALEAARAVDIVLFDKTGTLTRGEFGVDKIVPVAHGGEDEVLLYAASANSHSEHPLAGAMIREAYKRKMALHEARNFQRLPGKGVRVEIGCAEVLVGSVAMVEDRNMVLPPALKAETDMLARQGKTINIVLKDGAVLGALALADVIREESYDAIAVLRAMGVKTAMITGDSEDVARWVAGELGIDEYFAKVLPDQKAEKIKLLRSRGQKVAMVGDGVNDAPALALADLGIAIGAGTNVAIESAGIILVRNDPRDIASIIKLSRLTYTKMMQNLFWATGYNLAALPIAAGALAYRGIILEPAVAAVFMSLSTVIVAFNAMLLRRQNI